jgi:hypothetical protein
MEGFFMSKEPKDKTPQPVSTERQPGQSSKTRVYRELSPEEAREDSYQERLDHFASAARSTKAAGSVMGTVTHHGWRKPSDEIPQPTSIIMGRNLRPPQPELSEREKVLKSIRDFCDEQIA